MKHKSIVHVFDAMPTSDGAGVNLSRAIGQPKLRHADPFLMLDEIRSDQPNDYIAGFPPHPHKGFETISYMLTGSMAHKDSTGGEGIIGSGGVQYMTAGRGIIHSELPQQESGLLWGFQLWVNLPAKDKLQSPKYKDISQEYIPTVQLSVGANAKVIAGGTEVFGLKGPIERPDIDMQMFDISTSQSASQQLELSNELQGFLYVYKGHLNVNGYRVNSQQVATFQEGELLEITTEQNTGYLLLAGRPIREPIVQYGPFVMNTQAEIEEAIRDYQAGTFVTG